MFRLLTSMRATAVAALTLLTMALGATAANAQFQALPDLGYTAPSLGPIALDANPDGSAHAVWVADNSTTPPRFVKVDLATPPTFGFAVQPTQFFPGGELNEITGIAVDPVSRNVYIADGLRQRLLRFDIGDAIDNHATKQTPGALAPGCTAPCTVAPPVPPLPGPSIADGGFNSPAGLTATDTEVVAADSGNGRVESFDTDLVFGSKFTNIAWGTAKPIDTAVDPKTGHVFVALDSADRVDEFDAAGAFVKTIGSTQPAGGTAVAVEVDPATQLVYVAKSDVIDVYSEISGGLLSSLPVPTGVEGLALNSFSKALFVSIGGTTNAIKAFSFDTPPTCTDAGAATLKNTAVSLTIECGDTTGSPGKKIEIVSAPTGGALTLDAVTGAAEYTPSKNYTGTDTFTFRATTANGVSGVYNGSVTVIPAQPIVHVSANLGKSTGDVFIKLPGTDDFVPLMEDELVPLGTIVDATEGHAVTTFANADKTLYAATFWGGVFEMGQGTGDSPPAVMKLRDDELDDAAEDAKASSLAGGLKIAAKKKGKKKNKLWGDGKGNFTTTGSGGSASVRGTRWMVENYSNGTLFKVAKGKVLVRDYWAHKSLLLKIGDSYFAEKKPKKKKKK